MASDRALRTVSEEFLCCPQVYSYGRGGRAKSLNRASFKRPGTSPYPRTKPDGGGLWTSSFTSGGMTSWLQWCRDEEFASLTQRSYLLHPLVGARVLLVDTYDDLLALAARYGIQEKLSWSTYSTKAEGLDFEKMARDGWHGLHLTDEGQWATRWPGGSIYNSDFGALSLYGWDCESTLWLSWSFREDVLDLGRIKVHGRSEAQKASAWALSTAALLSIQKGREAVQ